MLLDKSGLVLGDNKEYLLEVRLAPLLEELPAETLDDLVEQLKIAPSKGMIDAVVEAMATNETSFFRDTSFFDFLYDSLLPKLIEARKCKRALRIWSAACATGQEPYSFLMGLYERRPEIASWKVEVLATDLSSKVLSQARDGRYNHFEVQRGLPIGYLVKYFTQDEKHYRLRPEIRSRVEFRTHNLKNSFHEFGVFDVILCRNVLIYFNAETKKAVLNRMARVLASDGYLFLGAAESTYRLTDSIEMLTGSEAIAYRRTDTASVV